MDVARDWVAHFLCGNHAAAYAAYNSYSPYLYRLNNAIGTLKSWLLPLIDQATRKPDLATIALLLIIVLVSLKILDILWQTLLFWIRTVKRVLFWGGFVALALWVLSRGPEGMVKDVQYWQQKWLQEYAYWKDQENVVRLARPGRNYQQPQGRWF